MYHAKNYAIVSRTVELYERASLTVSKLSNC